MLDPDYLERAGDMVAAVYGEIEAEMTAYLARLLLDQDLEELGQRGQTAVNLLAQSAAPKLMAMIEKARPDVSRAVAETVEDALRRSDAADARRLGGKLPEGAASSLPRQMELTARGIAAILERDNVEMTAAALALWNRCVAEAVAKANSGAVTAEQAVHAAVRRMMREGCSWVQYRDSETGRQTVANRVDVAVRRHVRTQLHQDGMRRTLDVCERAGVRLVEVSSHGGARPEHARWQGRVYSLDGDVTIGGKRYKDFYRETGYGKVDGLGGANCVPGSALVSGPDVQVAYRRKYEGDVVVIHTAFGNELTATPNHPVLTDKGWIPAQLIQEGDHVFRACFRDGVPLSVGPHDDHAPSPIAEVFDSLRDSSEIHSLLGSPADFHGDGAPDSEIDVVFSDGLLMDDVKPPRADHIPEQGFHPTTGSASSLPAESAALKVSIGATHPPHGIVRRSRECGPFLRAHAGQPCAHGGGAVLGRVAPLGKTTTDDRVASAHENSYVMLGDARLVQPHHLGVVEIEPSPVGSKTEFAESTPDDLPADPEHVTYSVDGEAFLVEPCEVIGVHRDSFSGHVYNLSTKGGWYFADGIVTHNCRHDFGPWIPGTPRMHEPDPPHPSGLPNDEVYRLAQGQRRRERGIRDAKRELAAAQLIADKDPSLANVAEVERAKAKLRGRQKGMRDFIAEANAKGDAPVLRRAPAREWAGDMPRIRKTDACRRTMGEFLDGDGVKRTLKARGVSKTAAQKAMSAEFKSQGIDTKSWQHLSKANQQSIFKRVMNAITPAKKPAGKHVAPFKKIKGDHTPSQDLAAVNPNYLSGIEWRINCQRCVAAYEMRRRGYDVTAKPHPMVNGLPDSSDTLSDRLDPHGWPSMFDGAVLEKCASNSGKGTRKKAESLMSGYGDGSRAIIRIQWNGRHAGGHVFIAEQRNGRTVFIDPQSGDADCSRYFDHATKDGTYLVRIDDKRITDRIKDAVEERK